MQSFHVQYVDLDENEIYPAVIQVQNGKIFSIEKTESTASFFALPGFVDAHVHIESSMLIPSEFAAMALRHGTLATVSDPHEIGNVLGIAGVRWMVENGRQSPLHFHFGAPSCVPATVFETAGAAIDVHEIEQLIKEGSCHYLAEMMNWPGVIFGDQVVHEKLALAKQLRVPIDGHAPGLRGQQAADYFKSGIETDHECFTLAEAREKAALGVKILIREGSAARNFDALIEILKEYPEQVMFCSDDKHPDDLVLGHINKLVSRAVGLGYDLFDAIRAATINPVKHYDIPLGRLKVGDSADFVLVTDLKQFEVEQTWSKGQLVYEKNKSCWKPSKCNSGPNYFSAHYPGQDVYQIKTEKSGRVKVRTIQAVEGQLITEEIAAELEVQGGYLQPDQNRDILSIAVVNRYAQAAPALGFIKGFGLKNGAIASSVAHDSHNVVAIGSHAQWIKKAVDAVMQAGGGISVASALGVFVLPLPVAGLMSLDDGEKVASAYQSLTEKANELGSTPRAPFMLLSFMALLVIPALKMSDLGLFDGSAFRFAAVEMEN